MHYKLVTLLAFAVQAMAADMENMNMPNAPATTAPPEVEQGDLLRVLLTALPSTLLEVAVTNQPEVSSIIASEFNAGVTPPWFKALPPPVQTYLENEGKPGTPAAATGLGPLPTTPAAPFTNASTSVATPRMTMIPTSTLKTKMLTTSAVTASEFGTTSMPTMPMTTARANQTSTAGAMPLPLPTAAIGAGVAGALGVMGFMGL